MEPGNYPLTIKPGQPLDLSIRWRGTDGQPVDLGGCVASIELFSSLGDEEPLAHLSDLTSDGVKALEEDIKVSVPGNVTSEPFWQSVEAYRLVLYRPGGEEVLLLEGAVSLA